MIKKQISYVDFNGNELDEVFYFHLSKAELIEMELSAGKEGLSDYLKVVIDAEDGAEIMRVFKEIVLKSYGKRSPDGKRFIKSEELRKEFEESPAYSEIFMEILMDTDKAAEFVNGVVADIRPQPKKPKLSEMTREELEARLAEMRGGE